MPASANKSYASYRDLGETIFNAYAKSVMPQLHVNPLIGCSETLRVLPRACSMRKLYLSPRSKITNMITFESHNSRSER